MLTNLNGTLIQTLFFKTLIFLNSSLHELVKHEENSFVFETSEELSHQIQNWFTNENQDKFKDALKHFTESRWETNWEKIASKAFQ